MFMRNASVNRMHRPKEYLLFCGLKLNSSRIMEQPQAKRKASVLWDQFYLVSEYKEFVLISVVSSCSSQNLHVIYLNSY